MSAVADRVAAGAAFLDEHDPQWWRADVERAINLDELELRDGTLCVLGQRCPVEWSKDREPFVTMAEHLSGLKGGYTVDNWGRQFGFTVSAHPDDIDDEWDALTGAWKRVITGRRSAS
jgi:hypothetical protein